MSAIIEGQERIADRIAHAESRIFLAQKSLDNFPAVESPEGPAAVPPQLLSEIRGALSTAGGVVREIETYRTSVNDRLALLVDAYETFGEVQLVAPTLSFMFVALSGLLFVISIRQALIAIRMQEDRDVLAHEPARLEAMASFVKRLEGERIDPEVFFGIVGIGPAQTPGEKAAVAATGPLATSISEIAKAIRGGGDA